MKFGRAELSADIGSIMDQTWTLFVIGIVAHASILLTRFDTIGKSEGYWYFPVALVGAGFLVWHRRFEWKLGRQIVEWDQQTEGTNPSSWDAPNQSFLWIGFIGSWCLLFFACFLGLELIGWASLLLYLSTLVYFRFGYRGIKALFPVLVLLLLIKPIPAALDSQFAYGLRWLSSFLGRNILDLFGVMNFSEGVVVHLADKDFAAEEACCTFQSLFATISAIVGWGIWNRYSINRHIVNTAQAIFWVVIFNAFRVSAVLVLQDFEVTDAAQIYSHWIIEWSIYFLIVGVVLSTDRLFAALFPPKEYEVELSYANSSSLAASESESIRGSSLLFNLVVAIFGILAVPSIGLFLQEAKALLSKPVGISTPSREMLPESLGDWKVVEFGHIHRPTVQLQGEESYVWTLEKDQQKIQLSIDGYFSQYHDLEDCYRLLGWKVELVRPNGIASPTSGDKELEPSKITKLYVSKPNGESATVFYSALDSKGSIVSPDHRSIFGVNSGVGRAVVGGIAKSFGFEGAEKPALPLSNVRLVYPLNLAEEPKLSENIRKLFIEARDIILEADVPNANNSKAINVDPSKVDLESTINDRSHNNSSSFHS